MLKKVAALIVLGHGLIHLMGFVLQWQLAELEGLTYTTAVLGGSMDIGVTGARVLGLLWLLAAIALVSAAIGLLLNAAWDRKLLLIAALFSLPITVLGWPDSQFGVLVNMFILAGLLFYDRVRKDAV